MYAQLNALQLVLDPRSLVWLNLFALDLRQSLEQFMEIYKLSDSQKPDEHVDIKVDGLMLKVNPVKRKADSSSLDARPGRVFHIQVKAKLVWVYCG